MGSLLHGLLRADRRAFLRHSMAAGLALHGIAAGATTLAAVRERGTLVVGVYDDMPPFHAGGKGIDVEIARAIAGALGLKVSLLPFAAGEDMNDDLRNMVWKGHYLGYGPADLLMHVPVDKPLMDANPQVTICAPYYHERVAMARSLEKVPDLDAMSRLAGQRIAVTGASLAGWLLIGADHGAYREQLQTAFKDGCECAKALQRGEVSAAAGLASELQSVLRGDARFAIEPLPLPRSTRDGWAAGLAVKRDGGELARALQEVVVQLAGTGRLREIFERHNVDWQPA